MLFLTQKRKDAKSRRKTESFCLPINRHVPFAFVLFLLILRCLNFAPLRLLFSLSKVVYSLVQ